MWLSANDLRRHAAERNRQIVKTLQIVVGKQSAIEQQTHRCTRVQPTRQGEAVFQAGLQPVGNASLSSLRRKFNA